MSVLIFKQVTESGNSKVFRIDSKSTAKTFGCSRKANLISIDPLSDKFDGVFEHREDGWHYVSFDIKNKTPDLKIKMDDSFQLANSKLHFFVHETKEHLYDDFSRLNTVGTAERQVYVVSRNNRILETKVLPKNTGFSFAIHGKQNLFKINATTDWISELHDGFEIKSKLIQVDPLSHLNQTQNVGLSQKEKRTVAATMALCLLLVFTAFVIPNETPLVAEKELPKAAMNVVFKTDKKVRQAQQKKVQAQKAPAQANKEVGGSAGGGRVSALLKGAVGVRISQLIGKVSATDARTANVLVTTGAKAGEGASGRALAAVGKVEASGRNWNGESAGSGTGVSTAGIGGGKGTKGLGGGLGQGKTGSGGVGLIEEESEVIGGLDREIIAQYIKTQLGQILYCYERQLSANPDLYGKVAVKFTISGNGQVETQSINDTTLKSVPVEGCILSKVAKWKFPEPRGGTKVLVTYPFLFKSTN
ncbi:MAG: hypothetical protein A2622_01355 [Bdellovibrionales bacterium RIFCSPHIGHO2_01_FULL_40_29]|nr:MAG: hypothetical protein A2622_01355 [Bdellovibrionales bacterium RIFCSPHIGHO2_01_FULL_40_29]OFZ32754.1 MAG: hypothetical protein A3D17_05955 [Bdellovibrionales bacterium RIFCSPHIGHO2_02_FULL_40_15]